MQPIFELDRAIYPLFYFAAALIAVLSGTRPAIIASGVMGWLAYWQLAGPVHSFALQFVPLFSLFIFAGTTAANIAFIHVFKEILIQNREARKNAEELAEGHAALFHEFNERAATYLQLVSALMGSRSMVQGDMNYEKAMAEVSLRTMQISKLHRSLERGHRFHTDIAAFVGHMLRNSIETAGASEVRVAMSGSKMLLPTSEATSVAVIMMEVIRIVLDTRLQSILFYTGEELGRRVLRLTAQISGELPPIAQLISRATQFINPAASQIDGKFHWYAEGRSIVAELEFPQADAQIILSDGPAGLSDLATATRH